MADALPNVGQRKKLCTTLTSPLLFTGWPQSCIAMHTMMADNAAHTRPDLYQYDVLTLGLTHLSHIGMAPFQPMTTMHNNAHNMPATY